MKQTSESPTPISSKSKSFSDFELMTSKELVELYNNKINNIFNIIELSIFNIIRGCICFILGAISLSLITMNHFFRRNIRWAKKTIFMYRFIDYYWTAEILKKNWHGSDLQDSIISYLTHKECDLGVIGIFFFGVWNKSKSISHLCVEHISSCLPSLTGVTDITSIEQLNSICNFVINCEKYDINYNFIIDILNLFSKIDSKPTNNVINYLATKIPDTENQKIIHTVAKEVAMNRDSSNS